MPPYSWIVMLLAVSVIINVIQVILLYLAVEESQFMFNFLKDAATVLINLSLVAVMLCVFWGVCFGLTELLLYLLSNIKSA